MREITVDLDVFSAIWAIRRPFESSENAVLRRLLLEQKEANTSRAIVQEAEERATIPKGKIRWIDDVQVALQRLGGEADLAAIYKAVSDIRENRGERSISSHDATVRNTIEYHSSDSDSFGRNASAPDYFCKVGRGRWRLRER